MDGPGSHSSGSSAAKTPRMHRCHCSLRLQLRVTEEADAGTDERRDSARAGGHVHAAGRSRAALCPVLTAASVNHSSSSAR